MFSCTHPSKMSKRYRETICQRCKSANFTSFVMECHHAQNQLQSEHELYAKTLSWADII